MKTSIASLAAAAALLALPALAEPGYRGDRDPPDHRHQAQPPAGDPEAHCDHAAVHPGHGHARWRDDRGGRYELRTTQRWVPGHYTQVFVPGTCVGHVVRVCSPGHYRHDWVPGGYVSEQQWVWVEDHRHRRHGARAWGRRW